jgi:uncharacterized protein (DUF1778 family)
MRIILTDEEFADFLMILDREPEDDPKMRTLFERESPFENEEE